MSSPFCSHAQKKPFTRSKRHRQSSHLRQQDSQDSLQSKQIQASLDRIQQSVNKQNNIAAVRYDAKMGVLQDSQNRQIQQYYGDSKRHSSQRKQDSGLAQLSSIHLSQFQDEQEEQMTQSLGPKQFQTLENPFAHDQLQVASSVQVPSAQHLVSKMHSSPKLLRSSNSERKIDTHDHMRLTFNSSGTN